MKQILTPETAPTMYSGRALIINDAGLTPIVQRPLSSHNNPGLWEIPGGKIEELDLRVGIAREVLEEVGIEVSVYPELILTEDYILPPDSKYPGVRRLGVCALAKTIEPYPEVVPQREEVINHDWVTIEDLLLRPDITKTTRSSVITLGEYVIESYYPDLFNYPVLRQSSN